MNKLIGQLLKSVGKLKCATQQVMSIVASAGVKIINQINKLNAIN